MNTITTTICPKIDIHSHIIYGVDDGCSNIEDTKEALRQIIKYNVKKIICTPHFNAYLDSKNIQEKFEYMKKGFKTHNIELYLGFEFKLTYENINLLKEQRFKKNFQNFKYILLELDRNEKLGFEDIIELINEIVDMGYIVIFAHPEFYENYRKIKFIKMLRENNIIIQCDATSFLRKSTSKKVYKFAKKILKKEYVDIISSDYHDSKIRNYINFQECYNFVLKRYGKIMASQLFYENPNFIVKKNYNE